MANNITTDTYALPVFQYSENGDTQLLVIAYPRIIVDDIASTWAPSDFGLPSEYRFTGYSFIGEWGPQEVPVPNLDPSRIPNYNASLIYRVFLSSDIEGLYLTANFVYDPAAAELPPDPEPPEHYEFAGWYYDEWFTEPYDGGAVYEDTDLYAKFTPIAYTITYILNGGANYAGNPETYTIIGGVSLYGAERAGYNFIGWDDGDGILPGGNEAYIEEGAGGDITLTAVWAPSDNVIVYNLGIEGAENNPANPATYTIEDETIALADPTCYGFTFTGWSEGGTIPAGSYGQKSFTANWVLSVYSITYVLNGGTNHPDNPATYTIWDEAITLADPTRTGFIFRGWWYDEGHTGPYNPEESKTGDFTLYAEWERIILRVTFYVGGEVYAEIDVEYGTTLQEAAQELKAATGANITFFEGEGGDIITESLSIEGLAVKTTNGTVAVFFRDTWYAWAIGGGVLLLIVVLVAIKKRR
jgi:uncharacterized repeat protein (TIGR02543 family)